MSTEVRAIIIIAICALCTFFERMLPFIIFKKGSVPELVRYLGKILPLAVIATLVVYCLRGISLESPTGFLPELIAVAVTAGLHLLRKNTFLSILGGTVSYMLLVQLVFV